MKKLLVFLLSLAFLMLAGACEDYVQEIDPLIDEIEDDRLTDAGQLPFMITGIQQRFSTTAGRAAMLADGLADQLFFDDQELPLATFPTYKEIDQGQIQLDNNTVDGLFNDVGELIFFTDGMLGRLDAMDGLTPELRTEATYIGNLYGGLGRYYLASYFGLTETQGGAPINVGPFIASADLYTEALSMLGTAAANSPDDAATRAVNSLIARIHLVTGNYSAAAASAAAGMVAGDAPFTALHSVETGNRFWQQAGGGRIQWTVDFRFNDFYTADSAEFARIPLATTTGNSGGTFYIQDKYPNEADAFQMITWQENSLMLAETAIRNGTGDGLTEVNAVRASYGIADMTSVDLDGIMVERDKTLFCTGIRLLDQRRTGTFHLPAGSWQYLPVTQQERNINPNL